MIIENIKKNSFVKWMKVFIQITYYFKYRQVVKKLNIDVLSPVESSCRVSAERLSISRFGDGEFNIIFDNRSIGFQDVNQDLIQELRVALKPSKTRVVGLPHGFSGQNIDKLSVASFWWRYVVKHESQIQKAIQIAGDSVFFDASFSRTVTELKSQDEIAQTISNVRDIWNQRDVILVEGAETRFGVGNALFDNARSVSRIIAPIHNAYDKIDELTDAAMHEAHKKSDPLVLAALGPTATVLAYRLDNVGIQTVDLGHFDLQFEYYLRGSSRPIRVANKYDNEIQGGTTVLTIDDADYSRQIIARF